MQKKNSGDRLLVLGSVTHAMKGREILWSYGIKTYVERTKPSAAYGCGYGLKISKEHLQAAEYLHRAGIKVLAVVEL